jgi:hypothetical protein
MRTHDRPSLRPGLDSVGPKSGILVAVGALSLALLLPRLAPAQGFGPQGGRGFRGGGPPVAFHPYSEFESHHFLGAGHCAFCHDGLVDAAGHDVSIAGKWRSSMLANAARDPLWQAKLASETGRTPGLAVAIEEKCARCHTPMARTEAAAHGSDVSVLGDGFLDRRHPLSGAALDGVSCTLCHQIRPDGLGTPSCFTGRYVIRTGVVAPDRPIFGPIRDPFSGPMRVHVGFTPTGAPHVAESRLCAPCHTLLTPVVGSDGRPKGEEEFPEQTTWLEWRHGAFAGGEGARSCQDCHLPAACSPAAISVRPPWLGVRPPLGQHRFVGGNTHVLGILMRHADELGCAADPAHFESTRALTRRQLREETAALSIESAEIRGDRLVAVFEVRNRTGHKLPSGVPLRRVWLHVRVTSADGSVLFESGRPGAGGRIVGNDADERPGALEPHRDVIRKPDEVQIWESILADTEGAVTHTFLRAASYRKDNRLLPAGFDAATAPPEIAVHGAAREDANYRGGSDRVTYEVDLSGGSRAVRLEAELLFQPVSFAFVEDLARDSRRPLVARYLRLHGEADPAPEVLARVSARSSL